MIKFHVSISLNRPAVELNYKQIPTLLIFLVAASSQLKRLQSSAYATCSASKVLTGNLLLWQCLVLSVPTFQRV